MYRQWAERLGEAGFTVFRYDKRFLTHPDLELATFDQEAQLADAVAAVTVLRSRPGPSVARLFIVGHSEGGTLAPLVAERAGGIAGVAIVNTVHFPVDELLIAQLQARRDVSSGAVEERRRLMAAIKVGSFPADGVVLGAGPSYWAQWITYSRNAPATLTRLSVPVLLVQCLGDETLPGETLERNRTILRAVAGSRKNVQLRELVSHDHRGIVPGERRPSPEFMRTLVDWLTRESQPAP